MSAMLPLQLEGVGFAVAGKCLLEGIDVRFESGSRTVVLGPNGAGKSLLLRICHGLVLPTVGRVAWAGEGRQAMAIGVARGIERYLRISPR